jgi:hypothetical protein
LVIPQFFTIDFTDTTLSQTQLQILTAVIKLYLKNPATSQSLIQKILQSATAESDNPDIRDRAYVYWRLLSSDPATARAIVLSQRPQITSTIPVLPRPLLDSLIPNLSTLSSVYHKPPQAFLGQGRSSALQAAAIEEAKQNARENPIAADAVSAAVAGGTPVAPQSNMENLLDIDFDGAAPASAATATPQRVASPAFANGAASSAAAGGMADLMGLGGGAAEVGASAGGADLMNDFAGMSMNDQPPPPQTQLNGNGGSGGGKQQTNEDLLGLF